MKIGILSRRSGVPVPTIKFYLREELLAPGELTSVNQASYSDAHLRRLRLIQSLCHVGGLSLKQIRGILGLIEDPSYNVHDVLGQTVLSANRGTYSNAEFVTAMAEVDAMIRRLGWQINDGSPAKLAAAAIVATLAALGEPDVKGLLDRLAYHADALAFAEMPTTPEQELISAVIGDRLLIALRRLAEENTYEERQP